MNWQAIGAIGEATGAVAVIATLIYLAIQIRQNTAQQRTSAAETTQREFNDFRLLLFESRDVAQLYLSGLNDLENLDEVDRLRFRAGFIGMIAAVGSRFDRIKEGALELEEGYLENLIQPMFSTKGALEIWNETRYQFSPEFQRFVEDLTGETNE